MHNICMVESTDCIWKKAMWPHCVFSILFATVEIIHNILGYVENSRLSISDPVGWFEPSENTMFSFRWLHTNENVMMYIKWKKESWS